MRHARGPVGAHKRVWPLGTGLRARLDGLRRSSWHLRATALRPRISAMSIGRGPVWKCAKSHAFTNGFAASFRHSLNLRNGTMQLHKQTATQTTMVKWRDLDTSTVKMWMERVPSTRRESAEFRSHFHANTRPVRERDLLYTYNSA